MSDGKKPLPSQLTLAHLKTQLDDLLKLQHQALDRATFLGMTRDESKLLDDHRKQISQIVDQLTKLKHELANVPTPAEDDSVPQ